MRSLKEAILESEPLLKPGPYGVSDADPKVRVIEDLGRVTAAAGVDVVIIGGVAVIVNGYPRTTVDVDLLVGRSEAMTLVRALEKSPNFSRMRVDRFKHLETERTVDLCVEGERTSPHHRDRFPSPSQVERLDRNPIPVVGLIDLLALKVKSGRTKDEADFVELCKARVPLKADLNNARAKVEDPTLRDQFDRLHERAWREMEDEKRRRPPRLDGAR